MTILDSPFLNICIEIFTFSDEFILICNENLRQVLSGIFSSKRDAQCRSMVVSGSANLEVGRIVGFLGQSLQVT